MATEKVHDYSCYTEGAKNKTYSVTIKSTEQKDQEVIQNSEEFKGNAKSRYKLKRKIVI